MGVTVGESVGSSGSGTAEPSVKVGTGAGGMKPPPACPGAASVGTDDVAVDGAPDAAPVVRGELAFAVARREGLLLSIVDGAGDDVEGLDEAGAGPTGPGATAPAEVWAAVGAVTR